jgi:hypothetical protein
MLNLPSPKNTQHLRTPDTIDTFQSISSENCLTSCNIHSQNLTKQLYSNSHLYFIINMHKCSSHYQMQTLCHLSKLPNIPELFPRGVQKSRWPKTAAKNIKRTWRCRFQKWEGSVTATKNMRTIPSCQTCGNTHTHTPAYEHGAPSQVYQKATLQIGTANSHEISHTEESQLLEAPSTCALTESALRYSVKSHVVVPSKEPQKHRVMAHTQVVCLD